MSSLGIGRTAFTMSGAAAAAAMALVPLIIADTPSDSTFLVAGAASSIAAVAAFALWPRWRWSRLKERISGRLHAHEVRMLLGAPSRIVETFPGDVTECWIYPPQAHLAGEPIGVGLAVDFDGSGKTHTLRRLKGRPS
jgi:hypothetical protein